MKKTLAVVTVLFVLVSGLFANIDNSHLVFGMGNDKFTYGISKNDDDQRTFSGYINYVFDNVSINLDMESYTNRGSWYDGNFAEGRLDAVYLNSGLSQEFKLSDKLFLCTKENVGFSLTGNFNFVFVQNVQHKNAGIEPVKLDYDWNTAVAEPTFGINAGLEYRVPYIDFSLYTDYFVTVNFLSRKTAQFGIKIEDTINAAIGYRSNKNFSTSTTMDTVADAENGLFFDFAIEAEPITISWEYYPRLNFGYGDVFIDALSFFKQSTWQKNDFLLDLSLSKLYGMELLNEGVRIPLNDKLGVSVGVGYVSGFPKYTVNDTNRIQRNYALAMAGILYHPVKWYISPYVMAQFGLGTFQVDVLNNAYKEEHIPDVENPAENVLVADVRLGTDILPEGLIKIGNSSIQLGIYGGTHIIPQYEKIKPVLSQRYNGHPEGWEAGLFDPYFGFGAVIGLSVPESL